MNNNYSLEGKIIETNRRYSAANKFFEQGVGLGLTSYNQLITISSVALGFLFSIKTEVIGNGLDLQGQKAFFFYFTAFFFIATIVTAIRRNYHAGYELVNLSRRFASKADMMWDGSGSEKHKIAILKQKKANNKRKLYSKLTRISFTGGILSLGYLIIIL